MVKDFKKELSHIDDNEKIREKLLLLAIYNEFYNSVNSATSDLFMQYYGPIMESTFALVASYANVQGKEVYSAESFMRLFWPLIQKSNLSAQTPVKELIEYFQSDSAAIMNSMIFVPVIDKHNELDLKTKVDIMACFREFLNDSFNVAVDVLKEEELEKLKADIAMELTVKLDEYLANAQGSTQGLANNLRPFLVASTKSYLFGRLEAGTLGFADTLGFDMCPEDTAEAMRESFSEIEQKIWLIGIVYGLSCAGNNTPESEAERADEICKILGISRLQYFGLAISMAFKINKIAEKEAEKMKLSEEDPNQGRH